MGRAQKLKEIRKNNREAYEQKRANKKALILRSIISIIILGVIVYGGGFGYNRYLKGYISKIKSNKTASEAGNKGEEKQVGSKKIGDHKYSAVPDMQIDIKKKYFADFETNMGNFKIELFADKAPKTVNNFVVLSRDKFYDGLTFHRVIQDFMIQGGDPKGDGTGDPGYKFADEINDIKLVKGVVAMANSGPNTNGSQFFIITKESTDWLQGKYNAFGRVIEGMDTVMKIEKVDKDANDKPKKEVKINKVNIEEK